MVTGLSAIGVIVALAFYAAVVYLVVAGVRLLLGAVMRARRAHLEIDQQAVGDFYGRDPQPPIVIGSRRPFDVTIFGWSESSPAPAQPDEQRRAA